MSADSLTAFFQMLSVERNASKRTLEAYGQDLLDLQAHAKVGAEGLLALGEADIAAFFDALHARGLAASTTQRKRSAVRQFYRFCVREGLAEEDPSRKIAAAKKGRPLPKILSREEVDALISAAGTKDAHQADRLRCLIEIAYASGMRVSEIVALRLDAV